MAWKPERSAVMEGLTIVLTYNNGEMTKAVTRGNGEVGEVITGNAKMFANVPVTIPYKGELILRGEAVIRYSDFEKINELIPEEGAKYKNPRNLCSGSVRQLNSRITKERNVNFFAFTLVKADGVDFKNSRREQLEWLASQGFQTVEYKEVTADNLRSTVSWFENAIKDLKSRNMKSLVIDLRNNPGGSLDIVVRVGEILLGKGMRIVSVGPTDSTEETVYNGKGSAIGVPVAVIVNENSASASEILAAAIQENEIGVVVGTNTYGKGVVQTTSYIESTGGWLKITTDAYYTPNGNNINGVGISPDILMELPEQYHRMAIPELVKNHQKEDTQLWEALDYVRERANEVS